jgi:hypothetical protein
VRVNTLCPGLIETGMTVGTFDYARERRTAGRIGQLNPLGRYGVAEGTRTARCSLVRCANGDTAEVAAVALFLASGERGTGLGVHGADGSRVRAQMSRRTSTARASQSTVGCRAPCLWLPAGSCRAHTCSAGEAPFMQHLLVAIVMIAVAHPSCTGQISCDVTRLVIFTRLATIIQLVEGTRLAKTIHRMLRITSHTAPSPFLISR